ncbi:MAG: FHA domain-containing protein [Pirellula sp.]|nr:FHA domain-containing protein [Pirellula sp.]
MQVNLKVLSGAAEGKIIPIKDEKYLIGRGDSCQLRPKSESISRKHCAIVQKDGRVLLVDLKSRNGTYVNDKQLSPEKAKILKSGDKIKCGNLEFEVEIEVGIANSKQAEVANVKQAAERITEQSSGFDSKESFDISSWLLEADQIDRPIPSQQPVEQETRQFTMEDTTRMDPAQIAEEAKAADDGKVRRPEKKEPMKLPKMHEGPTTKNTKDAATETLKKYFGGR